ncbi:GAF domain-containing protein [Fulvivirga sedimenti]|uniref:GAF domain-containing protein n=1 Tax=Fulvivirga sedimenti TaxID=2879465 RepID=A0A9X1HYG5_9BACT|nr:GAF domain-containing protein [Fulvivirga sedimenti]MCA6078877.1 GAF domain-containing protein [Fulvivirga sedimenti]
MKFNIGKKIFLGFLVLIVLFVINASIIFYNAYRIDSAVTLSSEVIRPSKEGISDLILMVTRSKMLVTNWVYLQSNVDDKEALKQLHSREYPELKEELTLLKDQWASDSQKVFLDSAFITFEGLIDTEQEIMGQLVTFEDYEDPLIKLLSEDAIESQVIPMTNQVIGILEEVASRQQDITEASDASMITATSQLRYITVILGAIIVLIGFLSAFVMTRSITTPINYLKELVSKLGRGQLPDAKSRKFNRDEIGEMAEAVNTLIDGLKSTTLFAENIGNGNYDSEFNPLSEHDVLGNALIEMRNNLARVAEEDKKRNWSTEGLARFGEILRKNNNNIKKLADEIIANLVKYLSANQGGLYIIDNKDGGDAVMDLSACYAWDKKKFVSQEILKGEGLVGQVWQEMATIYLTDVPDNYIKITSGLGDSNPTSILIVPLKVNDQIYGVVEIASFNEFTANEIEFVEKIAESIASTISSVKINATTQRLLEESQEMTEQMRSQEEEMRQNMEELQATQEEMQRSQQESEGTMEAVNNSVAFLEMNSDGKILKINQNFLDIMGYRKDDLIGEHHRIFVAKEDKQDEAYKQLFRELANGKKRHGEFQRISKLGEARFLYESYAPVLKSDGSISKILLFAYDLTRFYEKSEKVAQEEGVS